MKVRWIKCLLALAIAGVILTGCGQEAQQENETQNIVQTEGESGKTNDDSDLMKIETEYGELFYPGQWKEYVEISQEKEEEVLYVRFNANINETYYPLFEITIGKGDGDAAGKISDADGNLRHVYVHVEESENLSDLSEEEENRLYAMKEGINEIVDHLE